MENQTQEDKNVGLQPRPIYRIERHILGSNLQGDSRYCATAGVQCACNALSALRWSVVPRVTKWKKNDLDSILTVGDLNKKSLDKVQLRSVVELSRAVQADGFNFTLRYCGTRKL